jgi:hypothetical protein
MSTTPPEPPPRSSEPPPAPEFDIPNAEKYMLEADVMRRRQLRSALLHGSTRTWREHRKVWPGVVAGLVAVGLFVAIIAVKSAYDKDKENQEAEELNTFCDLTLDVEAAVGDLDINDPDEVSTVTDSAREMADNVPDHVADEIEEPVDTIARQLEAMLDAEDDSDRLEELNTEEAYVEAKDDLATFNNDNCDE